VLQLCLVALFARVSAQNSGLLPRRPGLDRLLETLTLERGLLLGLLLAVTGLLWSAAAFWQWREATEKSHTSPREQLYCGLLFRNPTDADKASAK